MKYNVRVEYECTPIRHISVQCPQCEKWFYGSDITDDDLCYSYQIDMAHFICPVCGKEFGRHIDWLTSAKCDTPHVEEMSYPEVYEGCMRRKEIWE